MVPTADSELKVFKQALEALHRKSWSKAAKLFTSVAERTCIRREPAILTSTTADTRS